MRFWFALVAYLGSDTVATWATARWLKLADRRFLALGFGCYVACSVCWLWGVSRADAPGLTRALALYPVLVLVVGVLVGLAFTGDRLTGRAWLGIALGIASAILLTTDAE